MLTQQSVLRSNDDEIVAKVIDGEAIIINLASGVYYSMANAGGLIWERIVAGQSLEAVATALADTYEVASDVAQADVLSIANQLLEEHLVHVAESAAATPPSVVSPPPASKRAYQTPKLDIFRDIGHLVALDPPMPGLKDLPWKGPTDG